MEIKCNYKLVDKYREKLEEFGFEIPGPFLVSLYEPEVVTLVYPSLDISNLPKMLEIFVELIEAGATAEGDLENEEAMIKRILESLHKLQELKK